MMLNFEGSIAFMIKSINAIHLLDGIRIQTDQRFKGEREERR